MPTIAIDFDGTITDYHGYLGKGNFDLPRRGAKRYINQLKSEGWCIIINTTRSEINEVKSYLSMYGICYDYVNYNPDNEKLDLSDKKVIADVYLDDRNVSFRGNWKKAYRSVLKFKIWWRK